MGEISNSNFAVHRIPFDNDNGETYLANNEYSRALLIGLSTLHASHLYSDVTLEAGNVSLPAHKVVLAATSPHFRRMFSHDCLESSSNVVKFPDVRPAVMKTVLTFIYSGRVNISDDSVKDILKMAHLFELNFLIEACGLYLKRNLRPKNAVATLHLSNLYEFKDLTASSIQCIVDHFNKVSEDILKLTSYELLEVIRSDQLHVYHEDHVLKVVTNWIEFNKEDNDAVVFNLMKSVRMSECSHGAIRKLLHRENQVPLQSSFIKSVEYCMTLSHPRRSYPPEPPDLYIVGGLASELSFVRLDLRSKTFSELPALPNPHAGHGCALVGGKLYVVGGKSTKKVDCYDPDKNCWLSCSPTSENIRNSVIVELDGMIYVCGGAYGGKESKMVQRYDPGKDEWTEVASMINPHVAGCGAVVNDRIYIISGKIRRSHGSVGTNMSTFCECYDPVKNSWQSIAPIPEALVYASASAVQDALFVTGGMFSRKQPTNKVYKYDVETGMWSSCPSMPYDRVCHISCAFKNKIYVIGGHPRNSNACLNVFIFDTTSSRWTEKKLLGNRRVLFAGCFDF